MHLEPQLRALLRQRDYSGATAHEPDEEQCNILVPIVIAVIVIAVTVVAQTWIVVVMTKSSEISQVVLTRSVQ